MALVGTVSGSNSTSNTAITGTLVIANTTTAFPNIQSDAILFVSGNIGGNSKSVFGGDIQISGSSVIDGDIAVNGGDITTTASTANIFASAATITLGNVGGSSTTRIAYGQTVSPAVKTIEIGTRGNSGSTTNISIGVNVAGVLGRTTLNQDVALTTGNLIGAPGSGANVMTLISSGNIIARLDTDNSAPGHKFAVQDYLNADKFSITEAGAAEIADTLFATGSITTSGSLRSIMSVGSEGGEIFLSSPASSTSINTGVTIDVYQEKLRIFEAGGTNRGGYIDVTKLGAGVLTDLNYSGSFHVYTSTVGSPFTLAIPDSATKIDIEICGAGGGGGSGRRGIAANGVYGGGGGAGGSYSSVTLNASTIRALSSNLTITIGAGGTGGLAVTTDSTNGNPGGAGNDTKVDAGATTILIAPGGPRGEAGTTTNGLGGAAAFTWKDPGGSGANSSNTVRPTRGALANYAGSGGAGAGVTTGGAALDGGNGGIGGDIRVDNVNRAGAGGTAAARNGGNATVTSTYSPTGAGGGGGGASRAGGGVAGNGGNGIQGSGGAGGGGNIDGVGNNSGAGGNGGDGWCVVRFS